jgi:hypothetical protein
MGKRGPKGWEPDWAEFDTLVGIQCTAAELSSYFGVSVDSIERAIKRTHKVKLAEYFAQKAKKGHISIRRALWKKAAAGDMTAIIFFYKNHMGFQDSMKIKHDGQGPKETAQAAKEFVGKIESLIEELKAAPKKIEEENKKMGLLAASLGIGTVK